jgi:hypothetical protein
MLGDVMSEQLCVWGQEGWDLGQAGAPRAWGMSALGLGRCLNMARRWIELGSVSFWRRSSRMLLPILFCFACPIWESNLDGERLLHGEWL